MGLVLLAGENDLAVARQQVEMKLAVVAFLQMKLAGHGDAPVITCTGVGAVSTSVAAIRHAAALQRERLHAVRVPEVDRVAVQPGQLPSEVLRGGVAGQFTNSSQASARSLTLW